MRTSNNDVIQVKYRTSSWKTMIKFTIAELSRDESYGAASRPQISGKKVVWLSSNFDESKIFLYDKNKIVEIDSTNVFFPKISGDNVVWSSVDSEGDNEIFLYNGKETIQLTDNDVHDGSPQISGENIVWVSNYGREIFLNNGRDVIQLNDNSSSNTSPVISGNKVAWSGADSNGDRQVFYYNGKETTKISQEKHRNLSHFQIFEDNIVGNVNSINDKDIEMVVNNKTTIQLAGMSCFPGSLSPRCNRDIRDNYSPQISGENVVWEIDGNLFLYNGRKTIQVDDYDRNVRGFSVQMSDDNVVWTGVDAEGNSEIFLYNGQDSIQLTDNDVIDKLPQISGNNVVWISENGWNEIFLYNGEKTTQLTDNNKLSKTDPRIDIDPKIDRNRVVWQRHNLADGTTSVMLATIDAPKYPLIPPSDRNYKIITSSTIIILGLIFLCWLRKLSIK